ncbi:response regulator [Metapseudomonas otitidis]|jgi:two-component system response regulator EvgA|uniref:Response regulator n=1 Tax=Metapseudomonas otitidis TaxID=319939 RepID=A0A1I0SMT5_9GAMM|nr:MULTISPECIES: response regulator transcription factor [Pseudomonas]MDL5601307.1 response regulator transcription factor [Bacillus subtilis]KIV67301.1 DNA-binding response regulator, LuxR family [Pseudomonas sp. FeS53a]MBO2927291.1 response regulator transcription factor [Pseudomonas otitidis]MCO7552804.1 response regulator transcription factor [Pseudomonas otitidis]MCP1618984.1 two-component system response regulator EvgA [Pseudomonas otitidis]
MSKILLIDNQPMIRFATRVLLEREGYEIVGETENGVEGLSMARSLRPDLVILDIAIPKLDGLEVLGRLSAMDVNLKLLVLTSLPAALYANRCLQAGATGYLSKQEQAVSLISATRSVLSGYSLFPSTVHLPSGAQEGGSPNDSQLLDSLSDRELAVLQNLANGKNNKEIAEQLFISHKTVSTYKSRLMDKLKTRNLVDLIDFARRYALPT